jgi:hypothetical protein
LVRVEARGIITNAAVNFGAAGGVSEVREKGKSQHFVPFEGVHVFAVRQTTHCSLFL